MAFLLIGLGVGAAGTSLLALPDSLNWSAWGTAWSTADLQGRVVLVVNVASRCGFTPQYTGLEALYRQFGPQGFEILGVNLDSRKEDLDAFLKENPLAWAQIVDPARAPQLSLTDESRRHGASGVTRRFVSVAHPGDGSGDHLQVVLFQIL